MLRIFKNFTKKEWGLMLVCFVLIFAQVWLELKMPDYMSEITVLVQTEGSKMADILKNGAYMLLCAFGSLVGAVIVGYLVSGLSATFSLRTRKQLFNKVEEMSMQEIKPENIKLTKKQADEIAKAFIDNDIIEYIKNHKAELEEFIED